MDPCSFRVGVFFSIPPFPHNQRPGNQTARRQGIVAIVPQAIAPIVNQVGLPGSKSRYLEVRVSGSMFFATCMAEAAWQASNPA